MTGWVKSGRGINQKEKIYAILRDENRWIDVYDIVRLAHKIRDETINKIGTPAIRRCLAELLDKGMVKKKKQNWIGDIYHDAPLWYAVPVCVCVSTFYSYK